MDVNGGINIDNSRYSNFVNGIKNETDNYAYGISFGTNKFKEKKYSLNYKANISYNVSASSINKAFETKYWTQDHQLDATVYLPWKLEVNNNLNLNIRQKTALFDNNTNVLLWNAYIGKKILKKDKGLIKLSAYDILNQNIGYSRYVNTNVIREDNYQTITRYFLLSFVWNFSKIPAGDIPAK